MIKYFYQLNAEFKQKKDILNNIVKSGLHIYNMSICCMLMRNKIFNKIL